MESSGMAALAGKVRRIANEFAVLPGVRLVAKPLYRRAFARNGQGNAYYGVFETYVQARANVPTTVPSSYDIEASGGMYRDRLDKITVSDFPLVYWLSRLLSGSQRRVFDLGGHIGVCYYAFRGYIDYPADIAWRVCDVPAVVAAGAEWARDHDPGHRLVFTSSPDDADGYDVLMVNGALQYLDYTLRELLARLDTPPPHVLINLSPMHPERGYFTLQNIRVAICPYRVMAVPELIAEMKDLGYEMVDHWESFERNLRVPFEPQCSIDSYHGFYFRRS